MEPWERTDSRAAPISLPNPYVTHPRTGRLFMSPGQKPEGRRGGPGRNPGDRRDRTDGDRRTSDRRTSDTGPQLYADSRWDPQTKKTRHPSEAQFEDRRFGPRSPDGSARALRGPRSGPGPPHEGPPVRGPPHASRVTFEVKMADFPELAVATPGTSAPPAPSWGPKPPSQGPASQGPPSQGPASQGPASQGPVSSNKTQSVNQRPAGSPGPRRHARDVRPLSAPQDRGTLHAVKPGPVKAPGGPERPASASASASWANVASQPPRKPVPRDEPLSGPQEEQEDGSSERKRRKRKKKPPRSSEEEPEEPTPLQEPPKFEDEEEFPDLGRPSTGAPRPAASSTAARPGTQKTEKATGKKSKVPLQLDIGTMLQVLERKQQSQKSKHDAKPLYLSVGGACPVGLKQPLVQKKGPWQQDKFAHNPLDSTSPMVKKGKQREVPKAKKPTQLKRVILKEREERKQNRLLQERGLDPDRDPRPDQERAVDPHRDPRPDEPSAGEQDQSEDAGEEPADQRHLADSDAEEEREEEEEEEEEQQEVEEQQKEEEEVEEQQEEEPEGRSEEQAAVEPLPPPTPHNPHKIHSRKFRDYCSQVLSKEVDECVSSLLRELVRFQDRLYQKDPMKARMKKRLVMGLREVLKHLRLGKVKCVVISPNCERSQSKGGLDEALHTIIETCRQRGVPFVFALSRKALGRCVNKAVPVSLVGIFNYDGAQDFYHKMIELSSEARKAYEEVLERVELGEQPEEEEVEEENPGQQRLRPAAPPPPPARVEEEVKEEPEYIKLWKKMLENDCNHPFLNFEEQLSCLSLDREEPRERDEQS